VKWFPRNDEALYAGLNRLEYLHLKLERIKAIPKILERFKISFEPSSRYDWLGGVPGLCHDCGTPTKKEGGFTWCPKGCFRMHVLLRPNS
jgi:hypothetical protein